MTTLKRNSNAVGLIDCLFKKNNSSIIIQQTYTPPYKQLKDVSKFQTHPNPSLAKRRTY